MFGSKAPAIIGKQVEGERPQPGSDASGQPAASTTGSTPTEPGRATMKDGTPDNTSGNTDS
jgi:hypothetical protein